MGKFNLVQRFSILSFFLIFVITLFGSVVELGLLKKIMIKREGIITSHFLRVEMYEHFLLDGLKKKVFSGNLFHFKMFMAQWLTVPEIIRVKIYDKEGTLIWSDQKDIIGKKFFPNENLTKALRGEIVANLGAPHKTEHIHEQEYDRVMEIYTPIFDSDSKELLGVIETYKHPQTLLTSISRTRKITWVMALLGGSLLYLTLFGIVYNSHKKQKRLEEDIKKSHERYMDLIENSPEMIHQIDEERAFLHVNKTETERLGFTLEEMKGMKLEDLAPPERREELFPHFNRILSDGKSTIETIFRTKDGEDIDVEINETGFFDQKTNRLIQTRAFIRDITVRKKLEQEIIQQEKMAGVGLLAAGLAHEVGNPIGIVESAVQFCLQKLNPEGSLKEYLEVIQRNITAADHTIRELLRFARPAESEHSEINVIELLKEACSIVTSECAQRGIVLKEAYPEETPCIFADRANLQHVFVNILLNSIEAISGGGEIAVTLEVDRAGEKVAIIFADNGPGIPQENLDKVFSPFFTTKDTGTGLGLSICHRVVESHEGKLSAVNLPQGGAKLTVSLPARWERATES